MVDQEKTGQADDQPPKGIDLHLLDTRTLTFENVSTLFEKLTGRKLSLQEQQDARRLWRDLDSQNREDEPGPATGSSSP